MPGTPTHGRIPPARGATGVSRPPAGPRAYPARPRAYKYIPGVGWTPAALRYPRGAQIPPQRSDTPAGPDTPAAHKYIQIRTNTYKYIQHTNIDKYIQIHIQIYTNTYRVLAGPPRRSDTPAALRYPSGAQIPPRRSDTPAGPDTPATYK
jgi:hypothetical protein